MPAEHTSGRVVLVLPVDRLDGWWVGRAKGKDNVDVPQDHVRSVLVELKFNVDINNSTGPVIFRPAVDGDGRRVFGRIRPFENSDRSANRESLAALERHFSCFFVCALVDLGVCGEGPIGGTLGGDFGAVDGNNGSSAYVGVGCESEVALNLSTPNGALPVHSDSELLLEGEGEGCRGGSSGGSCCSTKPKEIRSSTLRATTEEGTKVILRRHGGHHVVLFLTNATKGHSLRNNLGTLIHRLWLGRLVVVECSRWRGAVRAETTICRGGTPSTSKAFHAPAGHAGSSRAIVHEVLLHLLHLPFPNILLPLLHLLGGLRLLRFHEHYMHLLLM
mmetsp:Transcript_44661/g.82837  ORF Transcript_44661/g.82837 Transcript_44661/m.82837 type:complete len:332 (+) Transcript_44661:563-1558(+)